MFNYQQQSRHQLPRKGYIMKVTGEGELAVGPDIASINLGVITENKELIAAQQQNTEEVTTVVHSLLSLGITRDHIQTFDYRIESDYDFVDGKHIFRGYKVTHLLQVKIEKLAMVGTVVDTAVQNGANYVANVHFTVKSKESFYQQTLILAINNAMEKAKTMAKAIQVTLNPIPTLVTEEGTAIRPVYSHQETFVKGISSTQFEPGQLLVKASVLAEFHYN